MLSAASTSFRFAALLGCAVLVAVLGLVAGSTEIGIGPALSALGHTLVPSGDAFTSAAEIGAATAIEFGPRKRLTAVAEPSRRGKGSAKVVDPR